MQVQMAASFDGWSGEEMGLQVVSHFVWDLQPELLQEHIRFTSTDLLMLGGYWVLHRPSPPQDATGDHRTETAGLGSSHRREQRSYCR